MASFFAMNLFFGGLKPVNLHADPEVTATAAVIGADDGCDIPVIASECEDNVGVVDNLPVGWIEADPSGFSAVDFDPGV
mgnify:CR=1 FL=1